MTDRTPYTDSELADLLAEWDQKGGWQLDAGKAPRLIATVRRLRAEVDYWKRVAAERQEFLDWWAATSAKPEVTP